MTLVEKIHEVVGMDAQNLKPMRAIRVDIDQKKQKLHISYTPEAPKAIYDICDIGGSIIYTGEINGTGESQQCIKELSKGNYSLCVVDGYDMVKYPFQVS